VGIWLFRRLNPSQSYGASPAIWYHSVAYHPTQMNAPSFNPSQIGRYSTYLPRKDGRLSWRRRLVTYRVGLPARTGSYPSAYSNFVDRMKRVTAMPGHWKLLMWKYQAWQLFAITNIEARQIETNQATHRHRSST